MKPKANSGMNLISLNQMNEAIAAGWGSAPFTTFDWFLSFPFNQPSNVFIPQKKLKLYYNSTVTIYKI